MLSNGPQHDWMRTARLASWWLTLEDLHWPDYEAEERIVRRAERLAAGGVNAVVIFGLHFRWDFVPYFQRINSLLGRIVQECHRHGIKVIDHYSDTLTHRARDDKDRWYIRERLNHHVPLYPDIDQDFQYAGTLRNTWRTVDVRTAAPVYFEPYRCNVFCPNNPDYQRAATTYARRLFDEAGIDGLMDDDFVFYPGYYSCACDHCRSRFLRECGHSLPPADDATFWGNTENPAFRDWLAMRLRSVGDHFVRMRSAIGPNRPLFSCCSETSSRFVSDLGLVYDQLMRGCDTVCMEIVTVTPLRDCPKSYASQMPYRAIAQATGYLQGRTAHALEAADPAPLVSIAYAESPAQFFMCWALQKAWGHQSWVCKRTASRNEAEARKRYDDDAHLDGPLLWEGTHESLFSGAQCEADVGVVFSPSTRSFASEAQAKTHEREYFAWITALSRRGVLCDSILQQALQGKQAGPMLVERYPALLVPCAAALADSELEGLAEYARLGGQLTIIGECGTRDERGQSLPLPRHTALQATPGVRSLAPGVADDSEVMDPWIAHLPIRRLEPGTGTHGWHFNLYRRGPDVLLHMLNLTGLAQLPVDAPEEAVEFPLPESGTISCRLRVTATPTRARLFSPDGAEGVYVPMRAEPGFCTFDIPVRDSRRYGILHVEGALRC